MKKIFLILALLLTLNLVLANDYTVERIDINPAEFYGTSDNYQVKLVIGTPINYGISDNYQIYLGFLEPEKDKVGLGDVDFVSKGIPKYYICGILIIIVIFIFFFFFREKEECE